MALDKLTGLVLEGGGMRGVFTCGVLDYFMDSGIEFPYIVAVSAGACNGLSYMSHQRGRARFSNVEMLQEYRYIGFRHFWKQHSILDQDLLYRQFPEHILPFDYDACFSNPARFEMVTTDCQTGRPCYLEERTDPAKLVLLAKASSSLPFVCPITMVDGIPMLDGGIVDSIPVQHAIEQGYEHNVVVLTRNRGYRKQSKDIRLPSFIYKNYPKLREALSRRNACYNEQLEMVERLEDEGRITVVRPLKPVTVGRMETDVVKLEAFYDEGYACARRVMEAYVGRFV